MGLALDNCEVVLDVALVGTGGMMPLPNRWLSSVLLRYQGRLVLFDCGEGTQISLRALGWGLKDIGLVLISHVHGDHVTGMPGLLQTLGNSGRTDEVVLIGPLGFSAVVERLLVVASHLPFSVRYVELSGGESLEQVGQRADAMIARSLEAAAANASAGSTPRVALFGHAHILRILAARWLGLPPADGRLFVLGTGTVSVLGWERDTRVIQRWNRSFEE